MKLCKLLTSIFIGAIITSVIFSCSKITGEKAGIEKSNTYQITDGACGEIAFVDNIGTDSLSAAKTVRQREAKNFSSTSFMIQSTYLKVEDKNGIIPEEKFFALHILDKDSLHLHSVLQVITNKGNLYNLHWCAD